MAIKISEFSYYLRNFYLVAREISFAHWVGLNKFDRRTDEKLFSRSSMIRLEGDENA